MRERHAPIGRGSGLILLLLLVILLLVLRHTARPVSSRSVA